MQLGAFCSPAVSWGDRTVHSQAATTKAESRPPTPPLKRALARSIASDTLRVFFFRARPPQAAAAAAAARRPYMVRGHAKEVAQQKNAAKQAAMKKSGTQKASQTLTHVRSCERSAALHPNTPRSPTQGAAEKKLNFLCPLCKVRLPRLVA